MNTKPVPDNVLEAGDTGQIESTLSWSLFFNGGGG